MNAVSIRGDWVGRVIDGRFSLLEWLGGSGTSGTFLTELDASSLASTSDDRSSRAPRSQKAAIKLFSAPELVEDRLAAWTTTAELSHVHLVRILRFGRAEIDDVRLAYVVTELGEEVLSQIIPERALTPEETREMLGPVLDALSYIHAKGYVHGHLKPSNVLVIENEVKLSADGLIATGEHAHGFTNDIHNAPEMATGTITPAADIWSLGATIVEALTQQLPVWDAASHVDPVVPGTLPNPFAEIARTCLHVDPARRCTLNDIRAMLEGKPKPALPQAEPASEPPRKIAEKTEPAKIPLIPLIVGLVLVVAIIVGLLIHSNKTNTVPLQTETIKQGPPAEPESNTPSPPPSTTGTAKGEVLNRVVPDVPRKASDTIQGKISVTVRVTVDSTGGVKDAELTSHGPSAYFARLAMESARNWKFKPPQTNGQAAASTWLLHYEFRRSGTDVIPVETNP